MNDISVGKNSYAFPPWRVTLDEYIIKKIKLLYVCNLDSCIILFSTNN